MVGGRKEKKEVKLKSSTERENKREAGSQTTLKGEKPPASSFFGTI